MAGIPPKLLSELLSDEDYQYCMRQEVFGDHQCRGRVTFEHAFIWGGKQINEKWAIMPLCAWAHDVDEYQGGNNLDKRKNEYCCIIRATDADLAKYPKTDWRQLRTALVMQYGLPKKPTAFTLF